VVCRTGSRRRARPVLEAGWFGSQLGLLSEPAAALCAISAGPCLPSRRQSCTQTQHRPPTQRRCVAYCCDAKGGAPGFSALPALCHIRHQLSRTRCLQRGPCVRRAASESMLELPRLRSRSQQWNVSHVQAAQTPLIQKCLRNPAQRSAAPTHPVATSAVACMNNMIQSQGAHANLKRLCKSQVGNARRHVVQAVNF
jgi:hypothetical protein